MALVTLYLMFAIVKSSYGKALKAIREDEIAAESMGINLFKHKVMAFVIGAFFAGVGGGLLASLQGAINPLMFRFILTFNVLLVVVLGGMGSMTGSVISAFVVTSGLETLRVLDETIRIGPWTIPGVPGMRMVVFSTLLMIVVIFFQRGLMGTREMSWQGIIDFFKRFSSRKREVSPK